jgi:hypothetical protein
VAKKVSKGKVEKVIKEVKAGKLQSSSTVKKPKQTVKNK